MVQEFGGQARFAIENYGDSELARRFGVKRYPAVFVDDVLVATPKDFGFYGAGEGGRDGRYAPLKSAASHQRFRADLARMIRQLLAGDREGARAGAVSAVDEQLAALPAFSLRDLDGKPIARDALAGRVVLVEFWATWCPPCRGTLTRLGELAKQHGDRIAVLALAVESDEQKVRELVRELNLPLTWAMGSPQLARAFGDLSAVPTLFVFDRQGRAAGVFYGAPPGLHAEVEARVTELLGPAR